MFSICGLQSILQIIMKASQCLLWEVNIRSVLHMRNDDTSSQSSNTALSCSLQKLQAEMKESCDDEKITRLLD